MARDGERGRGDWKARLGSQDSDPYAEASGDSGPVDIAAVRRDDALIDAIAGDGPVATDSPEEFQLASLLADWRADIVEAPLPAGPDLDAIVAAVNQEIGARQARVAVGRRGGLRLVRPLMGAAAALALIIGGMTAFSYSAQPGDPLWRVKEVVFSQQAQTTIAQNAETNLNKADDAIKSGNPERAKTLLQSVQSNATQLDDSSRKNQLESKWNDLLAKLPPAIAASLVPTPANGTTEPTAVPSSVTPTAQSTGSGGNPTTDGSQPTATGEPTSGGGSGTEPSNVPPPTHSQPPTTPPTAEPPTSAPHEPTGAPTTVGSPEGGSAPGEKPGNPGRIGPPAHRSVMPTTPELQPEGTR
ncbi:anti-sigma-D factor RsdA [Nocardia terpenica]|uniref:Anti-sigma-D factor RsdA sigma factor binding region domain-containing protein n=1 Tax=Nocardia terpenica TaxID=455432 RepID=A0A291RE35_9NOCA|nr:anti-sigma-D factor RsdA [Nocardia terpenica]ATL65833.1 hypothetical protein CRH09_05965 [Nocardia terpenica]